MPKRSSTVLNVPESRPSIDPIDRETQMYALAMNLAEQQLRDGTASPSVIVQILRAGSPKGRTEKEILDRQKELITAKTETLQSAKRVEELYAEALSAMRTYSGQVDDDVEIFGDD